MSISLILLLVVTLVRLAIFAFVIYAAVQGVKALRKYNRSGEVLFVGFGSDHAGNDETELWPFCHYK